VAIRRTFLITSVGLELRYRSPASVHTMCEASQSGHPVYVPSLTSLPYEKAFERRRFLFERTSGGASHARQRESPRRLFYHRGNRLEYPNCPNPDAEKGRNGVRFRRHLSIDYAYRAQWWISRSNDSARHTTHCDLVNISNAY